MTVHRFRLRDRGAFHFAGRLGGLGLVGFVLAIVALASVAGRLAADPLVERAHDEVKAIQAELPEAADDFDDLLALRGRIEPYRDELRDLATQRGKQRDALKTRLADSAPEPEAAGVAEPASVVSARQDLRQAYAKADADYRQARLALTEADGMWTHLTDLRRDAFALQILARAQSPFDPAFWSRLIDHDLPRAFDRAKRVLAEEGEHARGEGAGRAVAILACLFALIVAVTIALNRWIARRDARSNAPDEGFDRRAATRHAFFALLLRGLPLPLIFGLLDGAVEYFDLSSDNLDLLFERGAVAALVVGASRGIMAALLSPSRPRFRLVDCATETAVVVRDATMLAINVFAAGILLTAVEDIVSAPSSVVLATSLFVALGVSVALVRGLVLVRDRPGPSALAPETAPGQDAPVALRLGWARPLLILVLAIGLGGAAAGYVSLAGFLMSRVAVVVVVVALAILLGLFIDDVFGEALTSRGQAGHAIAKAIGLRAEVLDLAATTIAGMLRLAIVCAALIFAFGPWGIRFGDINPFNSDLFAFSFAYVRFSVGTVSFALLTFAVGLFGTRLITGWLDRRLLPLTALDPGVRNSMTTVLGYLGFAITVAIALSQLGVNPQNITVVAGALSVGIGFGLQAITSNFISGLIVLAERPIRVGDVVAVKGEEGRVKKISVRSTLIAGFDRTDIIVPNTDILTAIVRNKSLSDRETRVKIILVVDHDADQDMVHEIMLTCAKTHPHVLADPPPSVFFTKVSEIGLEFELRALVDDLDNGDRVRSDMHFGIVRWFRANGIKLAGSVPTQLMIAAPATGNGRMPSPVAR